MKVVILCGGEGTRMREETEFKPKPLVEVGGKPILWHIMKIYQHYGYNEFILALGYKGHMIKEYFMNWRPLTSDFTLDTESHSVTYHNNGFDDFKITFVDTGQKSLTGERLRRLKDYIDGDEFMLTYGDGVADIDINKLVEFHRSQDTIGTITGAKPMTKYGIVHFNEATNKIIGFKQNMVGEYKDKEDQHDFFINGGFMVFKKEFIDHIKAESMIEETFIPLAKTGELSLFTHLGKWKAMDTYKEVEEMNEFWRKDPFWKVWSPHNQSEPEIKQTQTSMNNLAGSSKTISIQPLSKLGEAPQPHQEVKVLPRSLAGKNVLVTGGTGLVGSHLVERLLDAGAKVFCTVRSRNPQSYFYQHKFEERVVTIDCDITNAPRVFDVVSKYEIEYIFHLAAQPIVATSFINPYETFNSNILGTVNVLEAARRTPYIKGVIVASSDKAYGKDCLDATEDQPLAGDHPYDVSKSATDLIAKTYFNTYGLPVAITRFGNIFGPGDLNLNRIIPGIMKSIVRGETLEIRSDGQFVRDYVYVKDVVEGYLLLAENIEQVKGEAFNFSTGYNFSVLSLIQNIGATLGKECKYHIANNQKNEIPFQSLNYQKAIQRLGWKPVYTFSQGVMETFEWYKNFLS